MTTPIHVLCSNFTEIGRREVRETMCCFGDKKDRIMRVFFRRDFASVWRRATKFARERATWAAVPLQNVVPIDSGLPDLFPKK